MGVTAANASVVALGNAAAASLTPLQAYQHGSLSFSFGGAGFMLIYYVGVLKVLQQLGIVQPGSAPRAAGASSGALVSAVICSGIPEERLRRVVRNLTDTCAAKGGCFGRVDDLLTAQLAALLPPDAAARCRGRSYTSVSLVKQGEAVPSGNVLVDQYKNTADLISTLAASSYVPDWSGPEPYAVWRGVPAMDGGFTLVQPCPPRTSSAKNASGGGGYCVRVSNGAFAVKGGIDFKGLMHEVARISTGARPKADGVSLPPLPKAAAPITPGKLKASRAYGVDIYPGLSVGIPFDSGALNELSLLPCRPATCDFLYKLGQLDASAWAEATGLAAAARKRLQANGTAFATPAGSGPPAKGPVAGATAAKAPPVKAPQVTPSVAKPPAMKAPAAGATASPLAG